MTNLKVVCDRLTADLGISFVCQEGKDHVGDYIELVPAGLNPIEGFMIRVRTGWRSIESSFVLGTYAAPLVQSMGKADTEKKQLFAGLAAASQSAGDNIFLRINGFPSNPASLVTWPTSEWSSFDLRMESQPRMIPNVTEKERLVISYGERMLELVVSLMTIEEVSVGESVEGLPEGAKERVEVNKYERSHLNRQACIRIRGARCSVCGFDFGLSFGQLGEGYVHVHHVVPVSEIGQDYVVNPAADLVPVCPNCHAMLHRRNPPYTLDELRQIMVECGKSQM